MSKSTAIIAFESIQARRKKPWKGEEEVRFIWMKAIEEATGVQLHAERNRKDSSYNHVIIEFKAPGLFKAKKSSPSFINATEKRLLKYIKKESKVTKIDQSDFIGIAIDGEHICFSQVTNDKITTQHLIPFSPYAVNMVIDAIKSDTRRSITTENLLSDFGHGSQNAYELMQCLSDNLASELTLPNNNKIKMLFKEWRTLYGQVADISILQAEEINKEMAFSWQGEQKDSLPARLFVIHTYNSLLIKLIAAEIVSAHGLTSNKHPSQAMSAILSNDKLIQTLGNDIEKSALFERAGIKGFVEEAIFRCCSNNGHLI